MDGVAQNRRNPLTLVEALTHTRALHPDAPLLHVGSQSRSYADVAREADGLAAALASLGVQHQDRVAVFVEKSPEEVTSMLGIWRCGAIYTAVAPALKRPQVAHVLADSGARVLITTRLRLAMLGPLLAEADLDAVLVHGSGPEVAIPDGLTVLDRPGPGSYDGPAPVPDDLAALLYTSGSTGAPKGVALTHGNLLFGGQTVASSLDVGPDDRLLSVLPFTFDYGLHQLTTALVSGASLCLVPFRVIQDVLKALDSYNATGLAMIPSLWTLLLAEAWDHTTFPHLRYCTTAGGTLPPASLRQLGERLPDAQILVGYGLTEGFRATFLAPEQLRTKPSSIGRASPGCDAVLVDAEGRICADGEPGELVLRGPHIARGYWGAPERTAKRFRPWPFAPDGHPGVEVALYTGDLATRDADGDLFFVGRNDQLIKTSGYRVSSDQVEEVLLAQPQVEHAVVFGVPDATLGQRLIAVVTLREDVEPRAIQRAAARSLANYMVPRVVAVWDMLPRTGNGKLDRAGIKSRYLEENPSD